MIKMAKSWPIWLRRRMVAFRHCHGFIETIWRRHRQVTSSDVTSRSSLATRFNSTNHSIIWELEKTLARRACSHSTTSGFSTEEGSCLKWKPTAGLDAINNISLSFSNSISEHRLPITIASWKRPDSRRNSAPSWTTTQQATWTTTVTAWASLTCCLAVTRTIRASTTRTMRQRRASRRKRTNEWGTAAEETRCVSFSLPIAISSATWFHTSATSRRSTATRASAIRYSFCSSTSPTGFST